MRLQQTLQRFRNQFKARRRNQTSKKKSRRLQLEWLETRVVPTGTWTPLANLSPDTSGAGAMILLPNGSVLAQGGSDSSVNTWSILTPDSSGSYVNGTWSSVASSNLGRLFYGSVVLRDGRVLVVGGEYSGPSTTLNDTNTGEIYDPVANTWTNIPNYPESNFGDGFLSLLPNGQVLAAGCCSGNQFIYNPATNTWTTTPSTLLNSDNNNEEGWVKLAESGGNGFGLGSGNLLNYAIHGTSPQTGQRYNPSTNTWNSAGSVPVALDSLGELGPSLLLPDGRVFWIGATNHTALYTPTNNSWAAGPDTPNDASGNTVGAFDAPAAMEPNGKVLYAASPPASNFPGPTTIYEFDPSSNTTVAVPNTNGPGLGGPAFVDRMLVLPSGQILFTNDGRQLFAYTPDSSPNPSWAPTVTNIFGNTLTGTQLNGLSEGASYGDDAQMASNYPIIRLSGSDGITRFATTTNWSDTGVATGSALVTTNFSLPGGTPNANLMNVIANGIPSSNILYITDSTANDTITLDTFSFFGIPFISVTVNGVSSSWFAGSVSSIFVNMNGSNETVDVNNTWGGIPTFINSGFGSDTVNIGTGGSVQGVAGNVTIENEPAFNTININDSADTGAHTTTVQTVTITNDVDFDSDAFGQVTGLAPGTISYEYFDTSSVHIFTGTGGNTINVLSSQGTLDLVGSFGGTTVNVGNAGSVQGIFGSLNIENPPSFDVINVDDSADGTARTTFLTTGTNGNDSQGNADPYGFITGLAPGTISYEYFDTTSVTINTGNVAGNVVDVLATGVTTNLVGHAATTVNVGSSGSVQSIFGTLNIDNPPDFDTINIDDSADTTARSVVLSSFTPSGDSTFGQLLGLAPAPINYEYFDTSDVNIRTGSGIGYTIAVQATGGIGTTTFIGDSFATVTVGNAGSVQSIFSPLVFDNPPSFYSITVDDSADTTARTVTLSTGTNSHDSQGNSDPYGFITGLAPASISYEYFDTSFPITINTGTASGNVIDVLGTGVTTDIFSNAFTTVNIGNAGSVAGILGTLNLQNIPSVDAIVVDDSADTTARTTTLSSFTASDSDTGSDGTDSDLTGSLVVSGSAAINYEYFDTSSITLNTGTASGNVINVLATGVFTNIFSNALTTVNIGNAGSVAGIGGTLNLQNIPSFDTINVDDSADATARTVTLSSFTASDSDTGADGADSDLTGSITGLGAAPINYEYLDTSSITLRTGTAFGNVIDVLATGSTTNIFSNSFATVNIGNAGTVQGILGTLNLQNIPSVDAIVVDDSADTTARTTTLSTFTASDSDTAPDGADSDLTGSLVVSGSAAINYEYFDTSSITLNTGTASGNVINVLATGVTTNLRSNASTTVNVGNAGSAQGILGLLNIENVPSFDTIVVNDSLHNTTVATTVTLSTLGTNPFDSQANSDPWGQIVGLTPANIRYEYFDTTSLTIDGGGGTGLHTWNILATGVTTTINGGGGNDTFNVGTGGASSTLNAIAGALTVNGGLGTNTLNVNDQGTPSGSYTVSSTVLSRVAPSAVSITYGTIKTVNLNTGTAGGATLTVLLPVPTTTINYLAGGGGNTLVGANATNTWTITATNHGTLGKITFNDVQNLTGGANASDTFKFVGAGANITGNIDGGAGTGTNKLDYSLDGGLAVAVNLQTHTATRIGGIFSNINSLVGSTAATDTLTGANITNLWSITGLNLGKVNAFSYSAIENLVGGTQLDTFKFSLAGKETSIVGGGAPVGQGDWLDYSSLVAPNFATVNLATGTTAINGVANASVSGIQNVIGGAGNDILTGDSQGNILIEHGGAGTINGGTGRSLLIRGTGAATVNGGSSGDILIGGRTSYDTTNHAALMAILAEWQNTADSYAVRTDEISDGIIPGHPGIKLFVGLGGTVTETTAGVLNAAPGSDLDWFFMTATQVHSVLEAGEVTNNAS